MSSVETSLLQMTWSSSLKSDDFWYALTKSSRDNKFYYFLYNMDLHESIISYVKVDLQSRPANLRNKHRSVGHDRVFEIKKVCILKKGTA